MARILILLALCCLSCTCSSRAKEKKMSWWGAVETECLGRFCLDVPKAMSRAGGYSMQEVGLTEVVWPEPVAGAFARSWKAKLDEIAELPKQRTYPGQLTGEILERRTLSPGTFESIHYHPARHGNLTGQWTALLDGGSAGLWLESAQLLEDSPRLIASIAQIGGAYRLRKPGEPWPIPGADYFYLDNGLLILPARGQESARVQIDGLGIERLSFDIETVEKVEKETLLDGVTRMYRVLTSAGAQDIPSLAKLGARTVAGMKGEEGVLRSHSEHQLLFSWLYRGEANSPRHPRMEIEMEVSVKKNAAGGWNQEKEKQVKELWNALLDSMRPAAERR